MGNSKIFDEVPYFALLDDDERQILAQQVSLRKFRKGDIIFKGDEPGGYHHPLKQKPQAGLDMLTVVEKHLRSAHELMRTRVVWNPNEQIKEEESFGEKLADMVAKFGGSWKFVLLFAVILVIYVLTNSGLVHPWDPYPFILLNLFLSMLAAIQAPIIMMSQNRQDVRDRVRSELDYRVNLKAELEIEELLQRVGEIEEMLGEERMGKNTE